jgi:hypothetical protein
MSASARKKILRFHIVLSSYTFFSGLYYSYYNARNCKHYELNRRPLSFQQTSILHFQFHALLSVGDTVGRNLLIQDIKCTDYLVSSGRWRNCNYGDRVLSSEFLQVVSLVKADSVNSIAHILQEVPYT